MTSGTDSASAFAMADVAGKPVTRRLAIASGRIVLGGAYEAVIDRTLSKGDALLLGEVAGILGAKQTPALLPLCHPINLNRVRVLHRPEPDARAVRMYCAAEIGERTGVEMEALTGLNVALLTIWDLAKPLEPALRIEDVALRYKSGGKSGRWVHPDGLDDTIAGLVEQMDAAGAAQP